MRILLVDNHILFRAGIKEVLNEHSQHHRIDECSSIRKMYTILEDTDIDLVLLEVGVSINNGIDDIINIRDRYPTVKVAILSSEIDPVVIHRSIDFGAVGFITKYSTRDQLFEAISRIFENKVYLPLEYTNPTPRFGNTNNYQRSSTSILTCLSNRQREVLVLLLQGKPNKTISAMMNISQNTVKAHMSAIFRTLGAKNRTEAVYYAARAGVPFDLHSENSDCEQNTSTALENSYSMYKATA